MNYNWRDMISTGFGTGYLPAPGTMATFLVGAPLVILLQLYSWRLEWQLAFALVCSFGAVALLSHGVLAENKAHDPQEIVIDEVVGVMCAFVGSSVLTPQSFIARLILFRFFDITKLGPIGWCESLPGAWGVVLDDVVAGFAAALIAAVCGL